MTMTIWTNDCWISTDSAPLAAHVRAAICGDIMPRTRVGGPRRHEARAAALAAWIRESTVDRALLGRALRLWAIAREGGIVRQWPALPAPVREALDVVCGALGSRGGALHAPAVRAAIPRALELAGLSEGAQEAALDECIAAERWRDVERLLGARDLTGWVYTDGTALPPLRRPETDRDIHALLLAAGESEADCTWLLGESCTAEEAYMGTLHGAAQLASYAPWSHDVACADLIARLAPAHAGTDLPGGDLRWHRRSARRYALAWVAKTALGDGGLGEEWIAETVPWVEVVAGLLRAAAAWVPRGCVGHVSIL